MDRTPCLMKPGNIFIHVCCSCANELPVPSSTVETLFDYLHFCAWVQVRFVTSNIRQRIFFPLRDKATWVHLGDKGTR